MKKILKPFRHLLALLAVILFAVAITHLGVPMYIGAAFVACWQLSQIAMSKRRAMCFNTTGLSPEQIKEFEGILDGFKGYNQMFKELADLAKVEGGFAAIKKFPEMFKTMGDEQDRVKKELTKLRKESMLRQGDTGVRYVNGVPFVTDSCALALAGIYMGCAARQEKWNSKSLGDMEAGLTKAAEYLGVTRAALTSADIPLPTLYVPQIVELVYKYGQFRANATVFPMGAATVNLPQLKVGEDAFGIIAASGNVGEKKVAAQNVTHTVQKIGGIIRIPSEIEEDTFIPLGQFLARYVSRRFAHFEDSIGFLGDNSATYNRYGVGPYCAAQNGTPQLVQLAAGKTKPSDSTLANWRKLRTVVNAAVLQMGTACYYAHPTMEALFVTFNTLGAPLVYRPAQGGQPATLDGFPIKWVGVMQAYTEAAAPSAFLGLFGDLSYWFLDERGTPRVETSREVYFATDEIGMRAIERIDVEAMAPDAMSALQTPAQ
jgi:HK97 family phage major capsid protein